jgi:hypothetical protein
MARHGFVLLDVDLKLSILSTHGIIFNRAHERQRFIESNIIIV